MSENIIVIGGGVSGVTTALTLQLLGYDTTIYTAQTVDQVDNPNSQPAFASQFPSASIIPHSVYSDQLQSLFQYSQSTFYELRKLLFPGLTTHKHFEVFEFDPGQPQYCNWMLNLQPIADFDPDAIPKRPDADNLHGWAFDCLFADWPLYFPALMQLYKTCEGNIITKKLRTDDIPELPAELIINCSGAGSPTLFNDPVEKQLVLRGHLLHRPEAPLITNSENEIISYNYTPGASVYADSAGNACDVYCYPRKDGWIVGGSRQSGQLNQQSWNEQLADSDVTTIDGISFPSQIISLNNEILDSTFGHALNASDDLTPLVGYRYIRNTENGLRLESETSGSKRIYHNYGHGGAGVTLSWGCALHIVSMIGNNEIPEIGSQILEKLEEIEFSG